MVSPYAEFTLYHPSPLEKKKREREDVKCFLEVTKQITSVQAVCLSDDYLL